MVSIDAISAVGSPITVTIDETAETATVSSPETEEAEFTPSITVTEVPFDPQSAQDAEAVLNGVGLNSQSVLDQVRVLAAGNSNPSRGDLEALAAQVLQQDGLTTAQSQSVAGQLDLDDVLQTLLTDAAHPNSTTSIFESADSGQSVSQTVDPQEPMNVYAHQQADGSHLISIG